MAFTYTQNKVGFANNVKIITGTYTSAGGSTGGDITLPLINVYTVNLQPKGTAVSANQPVVNETLPLTGGINGLDITIVTSANEVGTYIAIGE